MLRHSLGVSTLLCVSYGIVVVCGILGNSFLITTLVKNSSLRTTTNIFIGNLAVSDLLVTVICVPFTLTSNLLTEWPFGGILCKLIAYFQAVAVNASINSLVAISIDRCLSINRPFGFIKRESKLIISLTAIWIFPIIYMAPWLFVFDAKPIDGNKKRKHTICADFWESKQISDAYFITVNLFLSYLLPLIIISICYLMIYKKIRSRNIPGELCPVQRRNLNYNSKIKIIKMILVVIIMFALSWLPLYILFVATKFLGYPDSKTEIKYFRALFPLAQWLATSNACVNPIIYTCYSRKFRNEFLMFFKKVNLLDNFNTKPTSAVTCYETRECILLSSSAIT